MSNAGAKDQLCPRCGEWHFAAHVVCENCLHKEPCKQCKGTGLYKPNPDPEVIGVGPCPSCNGKGEVPSIDNAIGAIKENFRDWENSHEH